MDIPYLADIFSDRIYLSAICALAMNSGAYQCETLRGAIAAIPSGQMEAGRSIGSDISTNDEIDHTTSVNKNLHTSTWK